jgi:hypothetical protein
VLNGNTIVDIWKSTYATFPPVSGGTITDAEKPTLTNADKNQDLLLTGFSTSVATGDIWRVYVSSATTVTRVTVLFNYTKI